MTLDAILAGLRPRRREAPGPAPSSPHPVHQGPLRVLVAGGGVGALETLLALRVLAGHRIHVTLLAPDATFSLRPQSVAEPFDRGAARRLDLGEIAADQGAELVLDALASVEPAEHVAVTASGRRERYDALVVATGAVPTEAVPGALTFRGPPDVAALRSLLDEAAHGGVGSIAFALPAASVWPLPLYELALMTAAHLRAHRVEVRVTVVTPEEQPLALFGPAAGGALGGLLEARGVALRTLSRPVRAEGGELVLEGGGRLPADRVVALAVLEGPAIEGLPSDARGFLSVDAFGAVQGAPDVFAVGDVAGFPLKQGGLAAQQADTVAEVLAARAGAAVEPQPFEPVLRGLLLTGGAPVYLRSRPGRLEGSSSVAEDAAARPRATGAGESAASEQALWWPPGKVAGRYLSPYLATARPHPLGSAPLADRAPLAGRPAPESERHDALGLALLLADSDARWGDLGAALSALDAASALEGALPPEYERKRELWLAQHAAGEDHED